ncbi:MAG: ABC transporter permease [Candidatus Jorgensenbacteria bacterium]
MKLGDIAQETYMAFTANKVRSGLTILGIVIGIGSVIAMVSIGEGTAGSIEANITSLGSNLLTVSPGAAQGDRGFVSLGRGSVQSLTKDDADALRGISGVTYVSPEYQGRFQIVSQTGNNTNATVVGATSEYVSVHNAFVLQGLFVTDQQVRSLGRVAVLGSTVAQDLFEEESPMGKTIRINNANFKVIGVLETKGGSSFQSSDNMVFIPLTSMQKILAGADYLSSIAVSVSEKEQMELVKEEATSLLIGRHRVSAESPDFSITSQEDILQSLTEVTDTFTAFLAAIAGISLLVGGIGIMNMMLTTVTERTREIGLRKAVGAKSRDISIQFLTEAVVLTLLGGIIGVGLGWIIAMLVSHFADISTKISVQSVFLAFGVSAAIGIIFGYYPARRASQLNPIEALRYE